MDLRNGIEKEWKVILKNWRSVLIQILIPTRNRPDSLKRCIESIDIGSYIYICTTNILKDLPKSTSANIDWYEEYPNKSVIECQNFMAADMCGHKLPIADDVEFDKGSIRKALDILEDGVVGFNVTNMTSTDTSFMLISEQYYNKYGLFFPEYKHFFADTEYGEQAKARGKFKFCKEATMKHYHPCSGAKIDETYKHARRDGIWQHDYELYKKRNPNAKI